MKGLTLTILFVIIKLTVFAQDSATLNKIQQKNEELLDKYCVITVKGKPVLTLNGQPVKADVILQEGNKVTVGGVYLRKNGSKTVLLDGECINKNGVISGKNRSEGHDGTDTLTTHR